MMDKKRFSFLLAAIAALCGVLLCACADGGKTPEGKPPVGPPDTPIVDPPIDDDPPEDVKIQGDKFFLRAEGADVLNGDGERIILRGINIGGLFVTEHWMTGFMYGKTPSNDYRSLTKTFIDRFGEQKTKELWAEYQANWWCEQDFINCAEMGFNVIRLPFTYMNVDFDAVSSYDNAGKNYDFSMLDAFVAKAAEYGMYTILDLHGAYGSQNGQDHSGQIMNNVRDVTYYTDARMKSLTVKLWQALAEHYKDEPAVAGYDILNEPGEKAGVTGKLHWDHFDEIYKAIRAVDQKHIVIFESCWDAENLPRRSTYGWNNCMYSFHHYAGDKLSQSEYFKSWDNKLSDIENAAFGVPLQMGEFTNYNTIYNWDYVLGFMNKNGWHWVSWTYKVWGNMPWGVVNIRGAGSNKVNAAEDSYEQILEKFKLLKSESGERFAFSDGTTLESVFAKYCKEQDEK